MLQLIPKFNNIVLISGLKLHIHVALLTSFLHCLITSSFLTSSASLPFNIKLLTHAEDHLTFVPKNKS